MGGEVCCAGWLCVVAWVAPEHTRRDAGIGHTLKYCDVVICGCGAEKGWVEMCVVGFGSCLVAWVTPVHVRRHAGGNTLKKKDYDAGDLWL